MGEREILLYPDDRLRTRCEPVREFGLDIQDLVGDLFDSLGDSIGLSAPQLGDARQVLVTRVDRRPMVFINPEITFQTAFGLVNESCVSVPEVETMVWRATRLRVKAADEYGEIIQRDLEGMDAVVLQHEMDHLVGKLLVDRLWWWKRRKVDAAARLRAAAS